MTDELAKANDTPEGFEDFDPQDITLVNRLRIVQPTSQVDGAEKGTFYNDLTMTCCSEIRFALLSVQKGQRFWPQGAESPVCFSRNGKQPDDNSIDRQNFDCYIRDEAGKLVAACTKAQWIDGKPSECQAVYTMQAVEISNPDAPFNIEMQFYGANVKPFRAMVASIWQKKAPIYGIKVTASLNKVQGKMGSYYVCAFGGYETIGDTYKPQYDMLKGV